MIAGGGGNTGFSRPFICDDENAYDSASFRICAAASWRFASLSAIRVAAASCATNDASGSLRASLAAARFAAAPAWVRGIATCAEAIASEALASHSDAPSLYLPRRSVELARSALHVRKASAPSPFHSTICGRTFRSSAILRISVAALSSRSAAP
ncbi:MULTISPECIES: hypothetical protein [unclassified Streptomyces]|uniref:hypothetical protein n=1 Tax=unclassified Streptomyces TaxID=2593676 RepID=UPI000967D4C7|nr:hypothetical protein [Streptomyces sp. TSRI0281]OKI38542.1 hypothetical protein A6A29_11435 [Streptomyces sp. TSRI0281]